MSLLLHLYLFAVSFPFCLSSYTPCSLKLALRSSQLTRRPPPHRFEKSTVTLILFCLSLYSSSSLFTSFRFLFCFNFFLLYLSSQFPFTHIPPPCKLFLFSFFVVSYYSFSYPFLIFQSFSFSILCSFPPFLTLCLRFSSPFVYFSLVLLSSTLSYPVSCVPCVLYTDIPCSWRRNLPRSLSQFLDQRTTSTLLSPPFRPGNYSDI
jgi:hypothetical protein